MDKGGIPSPIDVNKFDDSDEDTADTSNILELTVPDKKPSTDSRLSKPLPVCHVPAPTIKIRSNVAKKGYDIKGRQ